MGLDAHIMTNLGKKFCQEVADFIMSNECVAPCGIGEGEAMISNRQGCHPAGGAIFAGMVCSTL